jgi:hypothetical protein
MSIGVVRSFFDVIRRFIQRARNCEGRLVNGYDLDGDKENYDLNTYGTSDPGDSRA